MESVLLHLNNQPETAHDSRSIESVNISVMSDLLPSIYIGIGLALTQIFAQKVIFKRLAIKLGVAPKGFSASPQNEKLLLKFSESLWKLLCYSCLCAYGAATLFDKSWIWDTRAYWEDVPFQNVDSDIKYYYVAEMGLYISLSLTQFLGPKRKDFWMLVIHHFATMGLLLLSWGINAVRVGSAILLCHDVADIPLEFAKLADYVRAERVKSHSYHLFAATWFVTRLGIYPFWLLESAWEQYRRAGDSLAEHVCIGLLVVLLVLHIYWTYLILIVVVNVYVHKNEPDDARSSDEDEDAKEDLRKNNKIKNQ